MPDLIHDLVNDRIQTLHREAEEQRLILRVTRVQRARREVKRANDRLRQALSRQI
ncbi:MULTISPECIES: hypothetical protein [Nonomuraea]|uniref:Uncharacterized protein n=3 Tax=Nonomuraea TaxID=83681 RepID=A0A7X0NMR4_9ACTN|nr:MULTISPECIES: hypothetical protein [Nonomuraea]MBB6546266.1 hypothetical protein [Nonomuraea rubra]MCP2364696.1 hypothetical protein [Nonomuraea thailandensis]UBU12171.1 hypothetical protein LCN96_49100 [Nonomuraea gerenzanensis]SBP00693.1 hypothetical protein BN4615_P10209 [Nonomuraea gerenzanensis]